MHQKGLQFSEGAREELAVFEKAIHDILKVTMLAFNEEDVKLACQVEPLEEVVDCMNLDMKQRHIKRLREGNCTIELGFILADITTNFERVSDHCSNIAVCLLQAGEDEYDPHAYLSEIKQQKNADFRELVEAYKIRYRLP